METGTREAWLKQTIPNLPYHPCVAQRSTPFEALVTPEREPTFLTRSHVDNPAEPSKPMNGASSLGLDSS
jgi:hypothetical protein